MRWGLAVSATGQTGQSEAIHSPEAWASMVVRLTIPTVGSMAVVCTVAISCCPSVLHDVEAARERRIAEAALHLSWPCALDRGSEGLFRVDKLSLRLRQCTCQSDDRFTGPGHGSPPSSREHQSSPPPIWTACPALHARLPPSRRPASGP